VSNASESEFKSDRRFILVHTTNTQTIPRMLQYVVESFSLSS